MKKGMNIMKNNPNLKRIIAMAVLFVFVLHEMLSAFSGVVRAGGYSGPKFTIDLINGDGKSTSSKTWPKTLPTQKDVPFYPVPYFMGVNGCLINGYVIPHIVIEDQNKRQPNSGELMRYDSIKDAQFINDNFIVRGDTKVNKRGEYYIVVEGKNSYSGTIENVGYSVYGAALPVNAKINMASLYMSKDSAGKVIWYDSDNSSKLKPQITVTKKDADYSFDETKDVIWYYIKKGTETYNELLEYTSDFEADIKKLYIDRLTYKPSYEIESITTTKKPTAVGEYWAIAVLKGDSTHEPKILTAEFKIVKPVVKEQVYIVPDAGQGKTYGTPDTDITYKVYKDANLTTLNKSRTWKNDRLLSREGYGTVKGENAGEKKIILNPDISKELTDKYVFNLVKPKSDDMPTYEIKKKEINFSSMVKFFETDDPETDPAKKKVKTNTGGMIPFDYECNKADFDSFTPPFMVEDTISVLKLKSDGTPVDKVDGRAVYVKGKCILGAFGTGVKGSSKEITLTKNEHDKSGQQIALGFKAASSGNYKGEHWFNVGVYFSDGDLYNMSNAEVTLKESSFEYDGSLFVPQIENVTFGEKKLTFDDYKTYVEAGTAAGKYTIRLVGRGDYTGEKKVYYTVGSRDITFSAVDIIGIKAWVGSPVEPDITVRDGDKLLYEGTDYTLSYSDNNEPGMARVIVTGIGNYKGTFSRAFEIKKATLKYRAYVQKRNWMDWSTAAIGTAVNTTDFAGTTDNLRMETIQMQLSGVKGAVKYRAYCAKKGWTQWATTADTSTYAGTKGESRRVEMIQLSAKGEVADLYDMYYRTYCEKFGWLGWAANNQKSGSAGYARKLEAFQVQFVAKGEEFDTGAQKAFYDRTRDGDVQIQARAENVAAKQPYERYYLGIAEIILKEASPVFDGRVFVPEVDRVLYNGQTVPENDYEYTVKTGNYPGQYSVTIDGCGRYIGQKTVSFTIEQRPVTADMFSVKDIEYNGNKRGPAVSGTFAGVKLKKNLDYAVTYKNNVNVGTANATVTGLDGFSGSVDLNFKITSRSITKCTVADITAKAWTGSAVKPEAVVKDGTKKLVKGTDYTLSYKNNTAAGTATVTVTGKGNYTGTVTKEFEIKKVNLKYRAYAQKNSWTDWQTAPIGAAPKSTEFAGTKEALLLQVVQLKMSGIDGEIKYRACFAKKGWTDWSTTADTSVPAGTRGETNKMAMIQLKSVGQVATLYDLYYRTYCEKFGWLAWAKNTEKAGTSGYGYMIEAYQICFAPKGAQIKLSSTKQKCLYVKVDDGDNPK